MPIRKTLFGLFSLALIAGCQSAQTVESGTESPEWAIVIHGGAGVITPDSMTPEQEAAYRAAMLRAAETGSALLDEGRPAMDAVEAVIRDMEDDPLFNAGRGAVMTEIGGFSLDASIMDGATLDAGAVAGLSNVRHPITAARAVITDSPHVMLAGEGADQFAAQYGLEIVDPSYFFTERRWESLLRALERRGMPAPEKPIITGEAAKEATLLNDRGDKFGTVGVVALDRNGNLAAGTSTGGTTAKRWGRVGDSPIIGAGTYADNNSCAVSATGTGEYFIRLSIAYRICAHVELGGMDLQSAADLVIQDKLTALGGDGGIIALTTDGDPVWSFNTEGMYRASRVEGGETVIGIFGEAD